MIEAAEIVKALVAPAVIISACGLLCLAWYNRLAAIVSRARIFHKERFEVAAELAGIENANAAEKARIALLANRAAALEEQGRQILWRAKLIRNALMLLILAIMCMILCSLLLGGAAMNPVFADYALGFFITGALSMLAATVPALIELFYALDPVVIERASLRDEIGQDL